MACEHICTSNCRREGCNCNCGEYHLENAVKILDENGKTWDDVYQDGDDYYIFVEPTIMDEGENESYKLRKIVLPNN